MRLRGFKWSFKNCTRASWQGPAGTDLMSTLSMHSNALASSSFWAVGPDGTEQLVVT